MTADRFDELLSLYVDGRATETELGEIEAGLRSDAALRRAFVERVRLDVGLTALFESAVEVAEAPSPTQRARAPRRVTVASSRLRWPAFGVAAALFIAALLMLALRDRGPAPVEEASLAPVAGVEQARRAAVEEHAAAQADQRKTEERLAALRRREDAATRDDTPQAPSDESLARLRAERESAEAEFQEARERERRAAQELERVTRGVVPAPASPAPTRTQLATLERVEGDVRVAGRPAEAIGQAVYAGDALDISGPRSFAILVYPDRTRLELGGETVVRDFSESRLVLEKGALKAEVAHRPKDRPLVFATPHGEARILGTILRLSVDPDPKRGTTLEVQEGRVELRSTSGRSVEVDAGRQAALAAGVPLASKPLPREEILLALDVEDGKLPLPVEQGTVEAGPSRPGNRFCLAGVPSATGSSHLFLGDAGNGGNGLFTFAGDEVLSFDYWTDPQASQVNFNFWDRSRKMSHEGAVPKLVTGKWTHVTIRLADLGDAATRFTEGDGVAGFYIQSTGGGSTRRFYVDNLLITRARILKPRTK